MVNILMADPGASATGDLSLWPATITTSGTITSDATVTDFGSQTMKSNVTFASGEGYVRNASGDGLAAAAGRRMVSRVRFSTTAPSQASTFYRLFGSSEIAVLQINTNGTLRLTANAVVRNGPTVLAANLFYWIAFSYRTTAVGNWSMKVWINDSLEISASNLDGNLAAADADLFMVGLQASAVMSAWFSSIYVDDGSTVDNPGHLLLTAKRPASNNVNNFDTGIGSSPANRWTNVNTVPINTTTGWQQAATADVQENYGLEALSAGDTDLTGATIVGRMAWIYAKATAGGAGTPKITDNGSETAITLTSAAAIYRVFTTSSSYPSNAAGIGMRSTNNADDTFLYKCGTVIIYTAAPPAAPKNNRCIAMQQRMP